MLTPLILHVCSFVPVSCINGSHRVLLLMHSVIDEVTKVYQRDSRTFNSASSDKEQDVFSATGTKIWIQIDIYGSRVIQDRMKATLAALIFARFQQNTIVLYT